MDKGNFKVIIVDDGSEEPVTVKSSLYEFTIDIFRHDKNYGLPTALNTALKNVETRFFVRIDSDDYVHRSFLTVLRLKFELEADTKVVALDYAKVDENENLIAIYSCDEFPIGCAIMFRTEIIKVTGLYDEKMLLAEEIEFRKRVTEHFTIDRVALPLYRYTQHEHNLTNDDELYKHYIGKIND